MTEAPQRPHPAQSADTSFFWEGARNGQLLIQQCNQCGKLRHPPGPGCPSCGSLEWKAIESTGRGTVYSYAIHHYPPVPGFEYPNAVGLIELEEGTRLISNIVGIAPDAIEIGMPVEVVFEAFEGDLTLPQFKPRDS
jgi:uncharacterized OB-fold protein